MNKDLNNLSDSLSKLEGHNEFFIDDLFNKEFIKHYTNFDDLESFMKATNITTEEIQNYTSNEEKLDKIAQDYANFATFKDLLGQASIDKTLSDDGFDLN